MEKKLQPLAELKFPSEPELDTTIDVGDEQEQCIDREGAMAKADLYKLSQYSYKLFKKIEDEDQLESWVQAKITKAADYLASVYHYLEYEMKFSEYGHKLDNSDVLSESEKTELRKKLSEARSKIKELKLAQAEKLSEGKKSKPDFLDVDKDGDKKEPFKKAIKDKKTSEEEVCESNPSTKKPSKQEKKAPKEKSRKDYDSDEDYYHDYPEAMPDSYAKPHERVAEGKPSAGLTKKEKSAVVKKAKAGKDIGKKGKGFADVAAKAAKTYGSKEKGEKVAAAAMWKNIKESVSLADAVKPVAEPSSKIAQPKPQSVQASIENLKKTHPKLYAAIKANPQVEATILSDPETLIDLIAIGFVNEDYHLDELNLKPWEKKSAFSKKGYDKVADRQTSKMKQAELDTDTADEADDLEGLKKADQDWDKAKKFRDKAELKASKAKAESINESIEIDNLKKLSGL